MLRLSAVRARFYAQVEIKDRAIPRQELLQLNRILDSLAIAQELPQGVGGAEIKRLKDMFTALYTHYQVTKNPELREFYANLDHACGALLIYNHHNYFGTVGRVAMLGGGGTLGVQFLMDLLANIEMHPGVAGSATLALIGGYLYHLDIQARKLQTLELISPTLRKANDDIKAYLYKVGLDEETQAQLKI